MMTSSSRSLLKEVFMRSSNSIVPTWGPLWLQRTSWKSLQNGQRSFGVIISRSSNIPLYLFKATVHLNSDWNLMRQSLCTITWRKTVIPWIIAHFYCLWFLLQMMMQRMQQQIWRSSSVKLTSWDLKFRILSLKITICDLMSRIFCLRINIWQQECHSLKRNAQQDIVSSANISDVLNIYLHCYHVSLLVEYKQRCVLHICTKICTYMCLKLM